jgi:hypothetical protein
MSNSYSSQNNDTMGYYQRDILNTRRELREALSEAQTQHDDHLTPLYDSTIGSAALRTHQLVLDLCGEISPRQNEVPEIWNEAHIADYHHPRIQQDQITHIQQTITGLKSVLRWRNVQLPREHSHAGDTTATADIVAARAYMPVEIMSGARHQLDKALAKLGWLPEGEASDFVEPEPSI